MFVYVRFCITCVNVAWKWYANEAVNHLHAYGGAKSFAYVNGEKEVLQLQ